MEKLINYLRNLDKITEVKLINEVPTISGELKLTSKILSDIKGHIDRLGYTPRFVLNNSLIVIGEGITEFPHFIDTIKGSIFIKNTGLTNTNLGITHIGEHIAFQGNAMLEEIDFTGLNTYQSSVRSELLVTQCDKLTSVRNVDLSGNSIVMVDCESLSSITGIKGDHLQSITLQRLPALKTLSSEYEGEGSNKMAMVVLEETGIETITMHNTKDNNPDLVLVLTKNNSLKSVNTSHTKQVRIIGSSLAKLKGIGTTDILHLEDTNIVSLENSPKVNKVLVAKANTLMTSIKGCPFGVKRYTLNDNAIESLEGAPPETDGDFDCSGNKLVSLKFSPSKVGGSFNCSNNQIESLEEGPSSVGASYYCNKNNLTSLKGVADEVPAVFNCSYNYIADLEHGPSKAKHYECQHNKISSLKGIADVIDYLLCHNNMLADLEHGPSKVTRTYNCSHNRIKSLKGVPPLICDGNTQGSFDCSNNRLASDEGMPKNCYVTADNNFFMPNANK